MMKKRPQILIVEDDSNFVETLKDSLAMRQVDIKTAASVTEALNVLEKLTPSVIILDIQLPGMHGFELCRILKKSPRLKDIPVIFLSAKYTEPADRAEGMLAGADVFLSKPINPDVLWEEIRYLLDKKS